jgi:hypothetical protein
MIFTSLAQIHQPLAVIQGMDEGVVAASGCG